MRQLLPLAIGLTLIGCATSKNDVHNEAEAAKYDPTATARVRLFTGDNAHGGFVSGQTCEKFFNESLKNLPIEQSGWKTAHIDSEGLYPFRASDHQNSVIGMPASKASKTINESSRFYDEHVVTANQPFIANFGMVGSVSCSPRPVVFTPEPGQDYEMNFQIVKITTFKAGCIVQLRKLTDAGNTTIETPMRPQVCVRFDDGTFHTKDSLGMPSDVLGK